LTRPRSALSATRRIVAAVDHEDTYVFPVVHLDGIVAIYEALMASILAWLKRVLIA
jgi:hypothetical protein